VPVLTGDLASAEFNPFSPGGNKDSQFRIRQQPSQTLSKSSAGLKGNYQPETRIPISSLPWPPLPGPVSHHPLQIPRRPNFDSDQVVRGSHPPGQPASDLGTLHSIQCDATGVSSC